LFSDFVENIRDNKKDIAILLVWDIDSYTERFLALLPCTSVLQPTLVHFYLTSSLFPGPLPKVASASSRLLYSFLYSGHTNHTQVLSFLSFPYSSCMHSPCPIILLHCFRSMRDMRENMWFLAFWAWLNIDF
jgi:hypothetical protein